MACVASIDLAVLDHVCWATARLARRRHGSCVSARDGTATDTGQPPAVPAADTETRLSADELVLEMLHTLAADGQHVQQAHMGL
jgi:hypothetical protein